MGRYLIQTSNVVERPVQAVTGGTGRRVLILESMLPSAEHRILLDRAGIGVIVAIDGDDCIAQLVGDWTIGLVVADLALLPPAAIARLSRRDGPKLLALVADDGAELGGMALDANLAGFLTRDAGRQDYLAAVETALAKPGALQVADLSDTGIAQIGALSAEVERIVAALATLAAGERRIAAGGPLPVTALQVRAIIKARRLRERFFPASLFADPVWDMLLDLTAARLEGKPVAVSSLCLAAAVPTTTALRQVKALCDAGMFVRRVDVHDARRTFIELSEPSAQSMLDYLGSLRGEGPVI